MKQVRAGSPRKKSTSFSCCLFEGLRLAAVSVTLGKRERARERALDFGVHGGGGGEGSSLRFTGMNLDSLQKHMQTCLSIIKSPC